MYSVVLLAAMTVGGESADFGRRGGHGCHGCRGGCRGWHGCRGWGGCGGCYGCSGYSGCYGCGGCSGVVSYGCGGCYGGAVSYGCCGGVVSYGCGGGAPANGAETAPPPKEDGKKIGSAGKPATVIVRVPADASLTVDGKTTWTKSGRRVFETPSLPPGKDYAYTFQAEFDRDGQKMTVTRQVPVSSGRTVNVDLTQPATTAVASK